MRLDYTLYGLAIIFFIVAVVSIVVVSDQTGKMLLAVSTSVIGIVSASIGFMLRPKVQTAPSTPASTVVQEAAVEPTPQTTALIETPVVEAPKTETVPTVEVSAIEATAVVAVPQVEEHPVEAPAASEVVAEVPIAASAPIAPAVEAVAPASEVPIVVPVSTAGIINLTKIKGIGEKRATQLKANSINSVEDLAKADVADLSVKLKVSPKIVEKWVTDAKDLTK